MVREHGLGFSFSVLAAFPCGFTAFPCGFTAFNCPKRRTQQAPNCHDKRDQRDDMQGGFDSGCIICRCRTGAGGDDLAGARELRLLGEQSGHDQRISRRRGGRRVLPTGARTVPTHGVSPPPLRCPRHCLFVAKAPPFACSTPTGCRQTCEEAPLCCIFLVFPPS